MTKTNISKNDLLKTLIFENFKQTVKIVSKNGKPKVVNKKNIFCSGSDSRNIIFLGISKNFEIGVDIEFLKKRHKSFIKSISLENERKIFSKSKFADTIIWSLKESAQKSDTKIHDPNDYEIYIYKKQIYLKRAGKIWFSNFWIKKSFVFSVSIRVQ